MTTTSPAVAQPGPARGTGHKADANAKSDPHGFGRIMSAASQAGEAKTGHGRMPRDEAGDAAAPTEGKISRTAVGHKQVGSGTDGEQAGMDETGDDDTATVSDDSRKAMLALLPLLTAAQLRDAERKTGKVPDQAKADLAQATQGVRHTAKAGAVELATGEEKPARRIESLVRRIEPAATDKSPPAAPRAMLEANLAAMPAREPQRIGASDGKHRRDAMIDARETSAAARESSPVKVAATDTEVANIDRRTAAELLADRGDRSARRDAHDPKAAETRPAPGGDKPAVPNAAATPLSTGNPVVQAVSASPAWTATIHRIAAAAPGMQQAASPVEALKIQLHPAELGVVTANLRMADGQLSIEIDVDTQDAYLKLSGERDAISRALRSTGMAVDNVTINPPPSHQAAPSVRDAGGSFAGNQSFARQDFQGNGTSGQSGNSGNAGRQASGNSGHDHEHIAPTETRPNSGPAGGGVYI